MAKLDKLEKRDFEDLRINFADLEQTEINILELAHKISMESDPITACMGRAMKALVPGWARFMQDEFDRREDGGPGRAVIALTRISAMLLAMNIIGTSKGPKFAERCCKEVSKLFDGDLQMLVVKTVEDQANARKNQSAASERPGGSFWPTRKRSA